MNDSKKKLAVIYQKTDIPFLFESARKNDIQLVIINRPGEEIKKDYEAVVDSLELDIFGKPIESIAYLEKYCRENNVNGAFTMRESAIIWTSMFCTYMGYKNISLNTAYNCRDKTRMKQCFIENNVLSAKLFAIVDEVNKLDYLENDIEYPLIIKPAYGYHSTGVMLIRNKEELDSAITKLNGIVNEFNSESKKLIIEECVDGEEYVIETFTVDNETSVLSIGYKGNPKGPYFEESIYLAPTILEENVIDAIKKEAKKAVKALGIVNGPAHIEMRLADKNIPYILEIGARIGGSGVSHFIVEETSGVDFFGLCFNYFLGNKVTVPELHSNKYASNYIIPMQGQGYFKRIENIDEIRKNNATQLVIEFLEENEYAKGYPECTVYPGFVFSVHSSYKECIEYYRLLDEKLKVIWEEAL